MKVKITYNDIKKPILTIKDAIDASSFWPKPEWKDFVVGNAEDAVSKAPFVIEGEFFTAAQYHLYMEQQVAVATKNEEGYDIYSATQWTDYIQKVVSQVLGNSVYTSSINVMVNQLGGAYGGKITRSVFPACAAAVGSQLLDRPVRVAFDLKHSMEIVGKRNPFYAKYKVGYDQSGKILGVIIDWMEDGGNNPNDTLTQEGNYYIDNAYNISNWLIKAKMAKTNTAANTACRSPSKSFINFCLSKCLSHIKKNFFTQIKVGKK